MSPNQPISDLISISTSSACLLRDNNQWLIETKPILVPGYFEKLTKNVLLAMVQIPAGEFQMGSPTHESGRHESEENPHLVQMPSYSLGQTPVTQAQWKVVASWPKLDMDLNPDPSSFKGENRPVEQVTWEEAIEFCRRISARTKREYSLPSESQWEYACRAGTITPFAFGETLTSDLSNYNASHTYGTGPRGICRYETVDVGTFSSNSWGLKDMHGNVWEWCLNAWHQDYKTAKALRGGSWISLPMICRSAYRDAGMLNRRCKSIGFRVACLSSD